MIKKSIIIGVILVLVGAVIGMISKNWNYVLIFNGGIGIIAFLLATAYVKLFGSAATYGKAGKYKKSNNNITNAVFAFGGINIIGTIIIYIISLI